MSDAAPPSDPSPEPRSSSFDDRRDLVFVSVAESAKPFWYSKIFWVNVVFILYSIVDLASQSPLLGVPAEVRVLIVGVLNIILRALTTNPITFHTSSRNDTFPDVRGRDEIQSNLQ